MQYSKQSIIPFTQSPLAPVWEDGLNIRLHSLTARELDVLRLIASGSNTLEIASILCLSKETVRTHIRNLLGKLGVSSRLHAVLLWQRYLAENAREKKQKGDKLLI